MKSNLILLAIGLLSLLTIIGCKAKTIMDDPTVLEVHVLAEVDKGVPANKIQGELIEFSITDIKATNKTLNQYLYKVMLKGQSSEELLRAFNAKSYIKSAIIAPTGDGPAENMPSGTPKKTGPVKG